MPALPLQRRRRGGSAAAHLLSNFCIKKNEKGELCDRATRRNTTCILPSMPIPCAVLCMRIAYGTRYHMIVLCVFLRHCALIHGTKPPNRTHALHIAYAAERRGAPTSSHSYPLLARTSKGAFKGVRTIERHRVRQLARACLASNFTSITSSAPAVAPTPNDTGQPPTSSPPKPPASA